MSETGEDQEQRLDVLLFEVGGRMFGTDASSVVRVDRSERGSFVLSSLGDLKLGTRSLVFMGDGEAAGALQVDEVHGVSTVPVTELRRMPPCAGAHAYAVGVWLNGEKPVLLIDLKEGLRFHGRQ